MPCFAPTGVGDNRNGRIADLGGKRVPRDPAGDDFTVIHELFCSYPGLGHTPIDSLPSAHRFFRMPCQH